MGQVELPPQFVIPGGTELSAALDVARTAIRRAERRVVALRDAEGLASEAVLALPQPRLRPGLRDGPLRRRAQPAAVRRAGGTSVMRSAVARRRKGYEHEVEIREHRLIVDEPEDEGGTDAGPHADRAARRLARLLHRDHDRDVRRPQGVGAGRGRGRGRLRDARRRRCAAALRGQDPDPGRAQRRAARADPGDRRASARSTAPSTPRTSRSTTTSS